MNEKLKRIISVVFMVICMVSITISSFAATTAGQEMRTQVLYLCDIIENDNNMNEPVTRAEFARMIVKASKYKDSVLEGEVAFSFSDVDATSPYSSYIKIAARENYIPSFVSGHFKPNDFITYNDLIRGCLALLSYTNDDFKGNQISGRYETFCALRMNDNIDRKQNDNVMKKDAVNAIYNTLKTNKKDGNSAYGPSVFNKMSVNNDGELNASGLIKTKLEGPYILKRDGAALNLELPFDMINANIFINGVSQSYSEVMRELNNQGYLIYYFNKTTKTIYFYKEATTLDSSISVKKGYVNHIYYNASDTVTPTRVEIDLAYYNLGNSEVKFAFSYPGTISVGDQVIIIYTKSDNTQGDDDTEGSIVTDGTITKVFLYELRY